jgi:hypothetical protein
MIKNMDLSKKQSNFKLKLKSKKETKKLKPKGQNYKTRRLYVKSDFKNYNTHSIKDSKRLDDQDGGNDFSNDFSNITNNTTLEIPLD